MPARKIQLPNEIQDEGAYTRNVLSLIINSNLKFGIWSLKNIKK